MLHLIGSVRQGRNVCGGGDAPAHARAAELLTAADRADHVDARVRPDLRVERGALPVHVHVDVCAEGRARLAQTVAQTGPLLLETVERVVDGGGVYFEPARQAGEEGRKRRRKVKVGHG